MTKKRTFWYQNNSTSTNDDSNDKIDGRTVYKYIKPKELTPEEIQEAKINKLVYGKW